MKIMAIPEGIMAWETAKQPNGETIYLRATELGEMIRWLDKNRHGFIEDELKKHD
jgi:hypothetical protein